MTLTDLARAQPSAALGETDGAPSGEKLASWLLAELGLDRYRRAQPLYRYLRAEHDLNLTTDGRRLTRLHPRVGVAWWLGALSLADVRAINRALMAELDRAERSAEPEQAPWRVRYARASGQLHWPYVSPLTGVTCRSAEQADSDRL